MYIGIDLGTSSIKLLLVNQNGQILHQTVREYKIDFPEPGWSQQNPEDWITACRQALAELLCGVDAGEICSIGVSGQMHGLVILDKNDKIIRPCILWNDGRTEAETHWLNEEIGREKLTEYTGNIAFAGFTAPKLLWLQKNEPDNFARISRIMLPKDYIVYWLTGVHSSDPSDASGTLLYDVKNRCWSGEMLDICKLSAELLPDVHESSIAVGTVRKEIAEEFGFSHKLPVCAGAGDNAGAAIGCGIVNEGDCNISLGTSGTVFIAGSRFSADPNNALHSFAHANGAWHQMGCILSAASCNKWWMDILKTTDYAGEQDGIEKKLGNNQVYYLPYLMGERSPHNDTAARAAFIGLSMESSRQDMTQAVLEGVSFAIRDCVEAAKAQGIAVKSSMLCGGGAKSAAWRKILASVLNVPLTIPETEQGPAYGAAMLASIAAGQFKDISECSCSWVKIEDIIKPVSELVDKYNKRYGYWKKLYPALKF